MENGQVLGVMGFITRSVMRQPSLPGVCTFMVVPLIARGVTLGVAMFARAEQPRRS